MDERFIRTAMVIGEDSLETLSKKKVCIFGVGGVGGYVAEALARSGIGHFMLVDNDTVSTSNINRQIIAFESTVGQYKTKLMQKRIYDINPMVKVDTYEMFYLPENAHEIDLSDCDYIVDCIDTITAKLDIIQRADSMGIKIISSMGTGNKLEPTMLEVTDIYKTSVCPLAKVMRKELKKREIKKLKVVYSKEEPKRKGESDRVPGSTAFVPSAAGLIIASEVVKDLL